MTGAGLVHIPGITIATAFVAGAGYAIMSDTSPTQFIVRNWALGLPLSFLLALAVGRRIPEPATPLIRRIGRAVVAFVEAGLFVVLPVTAVWQAATAQGWTDWIVGRAAVWLAAIVAGAFIAGLSTRDQPGRPLRLATVTAMAAGYVIAGSALIPLGAAVLLELVPARRRAPIATAADGPPTTVQADLPMVPGQP